MSAERLWRYACLRSCCFDDTGDLVTSIRSTLLAPARPVAKGKLFMSLPKAKIVEHEDIISWSWRLSIFRDVAIPDKAEAGKISAIKIWLASKGKVNNHNQDFIASQTPNGWAKAESFETDSIVVQFEKKIKLIPKRQNLAKQPQRKNYPSKVLF